MVKECKWVFGILVGIVITVKNISVYIQKYFSRFNSSQRIWEFIQSHPTFVKEIEEEINLAIQKFNNFRKSGDQEIHAIPVPSSLYLKAILKEDLPTCEELIAIFDKNSDKELVEKIMIEISQFDFIDSIVPIENCVAALLLGAYRCAMRIVYPYLAQKNVQVASSLEEMIGIMALDGTKTKLFDAVKHWYKDYEEEGFSKEFSEAMQKV